MAEMNRGNHRHNCLMRYAYQAYEFSALRRPDKAFTPHPA
ncbi:hypothetical protein ECLT68_4497 [Escherichia coli LT-68]|nr:hypothetical protein ECLT68_4497 [Escherichia coli LT-68]